MLCLICFSLSTYAGLFILLNAFTSVGGNDTTELAKDNGIEVSLLTTF